MYHVILILDLLHPDYFCQQAAEISIGMCSSHGNALLSF